MKDTARTILAGIEFEFQASGVPGAATPTLQFRRNVFPMYKEILHNIVKHSGATHVGISVKASGRQFQMRIRDDGAGFDEKHSKGGNGLKNLRRRATDL